MVNNQTEVDVVQGKEVMLGVSDLDISSPLTATSPFEP